MLERADPRVRLWVVPGNHDIKGGAERFVRELGPVEFSFRRDRITYLVLNNAFGDPPDPILLEGLLSDIPPDRAVVLAMHVPPFDAKGEVQKGYEPFLAWLEKSRVQYLLCGHVHGYLRKTVGGTTVYDLTT